METHGLGAISCGFGGTSPGAWLREKIFLHHLMLLLELHMYKFYHYYLDQHEFFQSNIRRYYKHLLKKIRVF